MHEHALTWKIILYLIFLTGEREMQLLSVHGVGGGLLEAIEAFYKESEAYVRVGGG